MTAQMPPTPPAAKARKLCSDDLVASTTSSLTSAVDGRASFTSVTEVGIDEGKEDEGMLGEASCFGGVGAGLCEVQLTLNRLGCSIDFCSKLRR